MDSFFWCSHIRCCSKHLVNANKLVCHDCHRSRFMYGFSLKFHNIVSHCFKSSWFTAFFACCLRTRLSAMKDLSTSSHSVSTAVLALVPLSLKMLCHEEMFHNTVVNESTNSLPVLSATLACHPSSSSYKVDRILLRSLDFSVMLFPEPFLSCVVLAGSAVGCWFRKFCHSLLSILRTCCLAPVSSASSRKWNVTAVHPKADMQATAISTATLCVPTAGPHVRCTRQQR